MQLTQSTFKLTLSLPEWLNARFWVFNQNLTALVGFMLILRNCIMYENNEKNAIIIFKQVLSTCVTLSLKYTNKIRSTQHLPRTLSKFNSCFYHIHSQSHSHSHSGSHLRHFLIILSKLLYYTLINDFHALWFWYMFIFMPDLMSFRHVCVGINIQIPIRRWIPVTRAIYLLQILRDLKSVKPSVKYF